MGFAGLDWKTIQIGFTQGLDQRFDARASNPPSLDICKDVSFDDLGGAQTRPPFVVEGSNILGGGTISNARRMFRHNDELLLFTDSALYSWNEQLSVWVSKGTHLAVKMDEASRFVTTGDQVDCDRAELAGTIIYTWTDAGGVWVAAMDKATGSVLLVPTQVIAGGGGERPRVVALATTILLFYKDTTATSALFGFAIDPANVASSVATGITSATKVINETVFNAYYDVVQIGATDAALIAARRVVTTSYMLVNVTSALALTTSIKIRPCTGSIAVSIEPTGTSAQVVRCNVTDIQGDLITISTMADVFTGQAIGTEAAAATTKQIAAAHRSTSDGGQYRCYVFWSDVESTSPGAGTKVKTNWVDTGNTLGTQSVFRYNVGIASRAFSYNGSVYVWLAFAMQAETSAPQLLGSLQNTYYLYRDDSFLCAKSIASRAGGYSASASHLPGVVLTDTGTFSWCGVERRLLALGSNQQGYSARAPHEITFTFDSNEARRAVSLGPTLYIACGEGVLQYDGVGLYEVGFHVAPWMVNPSDTAVGLLGVGTYAYKMGLRWDNANGEREHSTAAVVATVVMAANRKTLIQASWMDNITHKTTSLAAAELWRTAVDPTADAPFFLVTATDPASSSDPNRYVLNAPGSEKFADLFDNFHDVTAKVKEENYENGSVLENMPPPAATIIMATDTRIFLAGVSGDPDRIWYSKQRDDGEVAAFNDTLVIDVPRAGGRLTGLAMQDGILVAFRETCCYEIPGEGFDNASGGQNYGPARPIPGGVGAVNMESVCETPGGIVFKSSKGWYVVTRGWQCQYIGGQVKRYDTDEVYAVHVVENKHQIRCLGDQRMLVFDYRPEVNQWSEWTISDGLHAAIWQGTYGYLTSTGPKFEQAELADLTYGWDVESSWIKMDDLQGAGRVRKMLLLGEYVSDFHLRVRVAYDYASDGAGGWLYTDDVFWTPTPTVVGGPLQMQKGPSRQQCQAIKIRLTAYAADEINPPSGGAAKLTGLGLEAGAKRGLYRRLAAAQKA